MALTVAEKEHWKSRIERKISKKVEALKRSDPELFRSLKEKAHQAALSRLGVVDAYEDIQTLKKKIEEQESLLKENQASLLSKLTGEAKGYSYCTENNIEGVVRRYLDEEEEALMRKNPLGAEVLKLEEEKDSLLDTVWLATSSRQVRDLWQRVSDLLGDETTDIQKEIFAQAQS